jgi:hypothetical protein
MCAGRHDRGLGQHTVPRWLNSVNWLTCVVRWAMYWNKAIRCVGVTSVIRPKSSTQILPSSADHSTGQHSTPQGRVSQYHSKQLKTACIA